jgi:2-oxoglutarate ferredoxin oxidoreductase subunit gamma
MYFDTIIAGFGGQGVMFIGNLLAYAAMREGKQVTYMPVYGVEMRGGTANCTVVIAEEPIGSPIIHYPVTAIVMNKPSLDRFGPQVKRGGVLLVNQSLIPAQEVRITGPKVLMVPSIELAAEAGNDRLANMVMLGALVAKTRVVKMESIQIALRETLEERYHKMIPVNLKVLEKGAEFALNDKEKKGVLR